MLYYVISALKGLHFHVDDDIIDKLNYYYTSGMLIVFAVLVSTKQYAGHPIQVCSHVTGKSSNYRLIFSILVLGARYVYR